MYEIKLNRMTFFLPLIGAKHILQYQYFRIFFVVIYCWYRIIKVSYYGRIKITELSQT